VSRWDNIALIGFRTTELVGTPAYVDVGAYEYVPLAP